jgi:hypothetical protein
VKKGAPRILTNASLESLADSFGQELFPEVGRQQSNHLKWKPAVFDEPPN